MNSATLTTTYKNTAGTVTVISETVTGDLEQNVEREQLAAGSMNIEFDINVPYTKIKAMALGCKKSAVVGGVLNEGDCEVVVKTNSSGSPDDEFTLTPQNGYGWTPGSVTDLLVTADITKLYVDVTGTARADIMFRFLIDSTPVLPD